MKKIYIMIISFIVLFLAGCVKEEKYPIGKYISDNLITEYNLEFMKEMPSREKLENLGFTKGPYSEFENYYNDDVRLLFTEVSGEYILTEITLYNNYEFFGVEKDYTYEKVYNHLPFKNIIPNITEENYDLTTKKYQYYLTFDYNENLDFEYCFSKTGYSGYKLDFIKFKYNG